jgi:hypothetical protein
MARWLLHEPILLPLLSYGFLPKIIFLKKECHGKGYR